MYPAAHQVHRGGAVATFIKIDGPSGPRWKALVRRKRDGRLVYSAARTFSRRALAVAWAAKIEGALEDPAKMERIGAGPTVGDLIRRYIREVDQIRPLGRTHRAVLELLQEWPIAGKVASALRGRDIVDHCEARAKKGTGPATVMQDVVLLRGPLGIARVKWNLDGVSNLPIDDAMPLLVKLGLVARSKRRDRRLEGDEGKRLLAYFRKQDEDAVIPMADIMDFALWTALRISSICSARWENLNRKDKTLTVHVKDPRNRERVHTLPLLGDAMKIIERQPVTDERIFPYLPTSVGTRFTNAKKRVKPPIYNLRFHDLKREAVSRLFEAGYDVKEVAQVAGNKDINMLWNIYTNLDPAKFKRR